MTRPGFAEPGSAAIPAAIEDLRRRARRRLAQELPDATQAAGAGPFGDAALSGRMIPPGAIEAAQPAAVLVAIVARAVPAVLLTERASGMRKHSGQIAFPGGRIDEPGESPLEAALREAHEEIGLDPARVEPIGYLDPYYTGSGYRIAPVVAIVAPPFELSLNASEVAAAFEVPLDFLMLPSNHQQILRERDGRRFYAMPFGERYIWGATAAIIRRLYEKLYR